MDSPLWHPSESATESSNLARFVRYLSDRHGETLDNYPALHAYSVDQAEEFWAAVWAYCDVIAPQRGDTVIANGDKMPGARFFPDAKLNFAENLLRRNDDGPAIHFRAEDKLRRTLSWRDLNTAVFRVAAGLRAAGVGVGDRCAAFVPNAPESVIGMLAAASIGAVWTSCSPDFGVQGVLDRFGQVEPTVLFACDGYYYNGKWISTVERVAEIAAKLPTVKQVILFSISGDTPETSALPNAVTWADFCGDGPAGAVEFVHLPFSHPLYILYSSGTTGVPKCIVHSAGGTLLKHLEEQKLQCDIKRDDRVFYFTTCGWMMWNWLVSALACEATLVLFDGSPFAPAPTVLFDYSDETGITFFGTSAKFIDALANAKAEPVKTHDLSTVRTIASTGSPLVPESFDYVYRSVKKDVCLASIAGGTDIVGCFVGGNPLGAVWRGEIMGPMLGMKVDVFSPEGTPLKGEKGELVCTQPFPSMPVGFWNDPDNARYHAAYFERFPNVWCHGDFVAWTEHGGMVIYGRSDATLNPGGVRIGTAEIYRQVEAFDEVEEALCIGQSWEHDTRVLLFVRMKDGEILDTAMVDRIRKRIRQNCSPRHVPAKVVAVADIPRTKSGKITELAVRDVVEGRPVKNKEALANPEALDLYAGIPELQEP